MPEDANVVEVRRLWKLWQRDGIEAVWESVIATGVLRRETARATATMQVAWWALTIRPGPEPVRRVIALSGADRLLPLEHAA